MKAIFLLFFSMAVSCVCCVAQATEDKTEDTTVAVTAVHILYLKNGAPFDRECAAAMNKTIRPDDVNELYNRLDEFKTSWEQDGPSYLRTAFKEVGIPFPYKEMQATLTICDFSSMSTPLIINVKRFLSSTQNPLPMWAFPELLFHEMMHTYTRAVYDASPLRKKYANEPPVILNHLHSMALEKLVLTKLNKSDMLRWLDNRYRNQFGPEYKKAWEIVCDVEGYEAFIAELKALSKKM